MKSKKLLASIALIALLTLLYLPGRSDAQKKGGENPKVLIKTSMGDITVELFKKEAPITVKNFLNYVDKKFYDGTVFHRIIPGFVIQGGGYTPDLIKKKTNPPIKNEATNGLKNLKGTLSMARTMDIDSATSQFFINLRDNRSLDHRDNTRRGFGYAVFGKVIKGWDVVEKIAAVQTTTKKGLKNTPKKPVIIKSIRRIPATSKVKKK